LLVEDDIVLLAYGDKAPSKVKYIHAVGIEGNLGRQQLLKPDFFSSSVPKLASGTNGLYYFKVLETPLRKIFESALNSERPETMMAIQFRLLENIIVHYVLWIVLGVSTLINTLRLLLVIKSEDQIKSIFEIIGELQIYVWVAILPLAFPTFTVILRTYGNAQILSLFDALQSSKSEFQDKEDVDEFDEAPAPTKDVKVSWGSSF
jgi:hypothetical protein